MTLGMDGFLRWAWDNYVNDMHGNITYRYWEPGDGWYIYPVERDAIGENYEAGFYSTPRYELFKQGVRDVAKAKYLMEQSDVTEMELQDAVFAKGYYPQDTKIQDMDPSFIEGWAVGYWPQVFELIKDIRKNGIKFD
jgi:hypothetical protein